MKNEHREYLGIVDKTSTYTCRPIPAYLSKVRSSRQVYRSLHKTEISWSGPRIACPYLHIGVSAGFSGRKRWMTEVDS